MSGRLRWVLAGFVLGAVAAFLLGLFRRRALGAQTGYLPPEPATGPEVSTEVLDEPVAGQPSLS